ncbi:hypothetical protein D9M73_296980 [compost metagenome]
MLGQDVGVALAEGDQFAAHIGVVEQKTLGEIGHAGLAAFGPVWPKGWRFYAQIRRLTKGRLSIAGAGVFYRSEPGGGSWSSP